MTPTTRDRQKRAADRANRRRCLRRATDYLRRATGCLLGVVLLVGALVARGQPPASPPALPRVRSAYRYPAQAGAADEIAGSLRPVDRNPLTLFALSRMLSEPCDRLRWLAGQLADPQRFPADDATRTLAAQTLDKLQQWSQRPDSGLAGCADVLALVRSRLERIRKPPENVWDITDPARLAARWQKLPESARNALDVSRKLTLAARGVPPTALRLDGARPWNVPRKVIERLAASEQLPPAWELLRLDQTLRDAENATQTWQDIAFPVADTMRIARGLLDRALGVDAIDRGQPPPDWAALAQRLAARDAWLWATMAYLLDAGNRTDTNAGVQAATNAWTRFAQVGSALGGATMPAVQGSAGAWLSRVADARAATAEGRLPLRIGFRDARRQARKTYENQFLQARGNPDEALRLIQLAKAADAGIPGLAPISRAALERKFQKQIRRATALQVHGLFEVIAVHPSAGPPQFYAFVLRPRGWDWVAQAFEAKVIGPADSLTTLVRGELPIDTSTPTDLLFLVAPDGSCDTDWWTYEREALLPHTRTQPGGLFYLPSVAALQSAAWNFDRAMRWWYRLTLASGDTTAGCYARGRRVQSNRQTVGDFVDLAVHATSIGRWPRTVRTIPGRGPQRLITGFRTVKTRARGPLPLALMLSQP